MTRHGPPVQHTDLTTPNRVGIDSAVHNAPALLVAAQQGSKPQFSHIRHEIPRLLAQVALAGLTALAVWRVSPAEATALGVVLLYAFTPMGCYYWAVLLVLPFVRRSGPAIFALLAVGIAMWWLHTASPDNSVRFASFSTALGGVLVIWLLGSTRRKEERGGRC